MKSKDYKSIVDILNKRYQGKKFFDFMDFGDVQTRIDQEFIIENNVFYLPENYTNKLTKTDSEE